MKRIYLALAVGLILSSCAPVLNKSYLNESERDVSFNALRQSPDMYKGRVYSFGGVIVQTTLIPEGSQIEALEVPVDRYGHFQEEGMSQGRFLALLPAGEGMLDPEVYKKGRRITLAGEFARLRKSRIDEMEYDYPVFLVRQIYLWPRERTYYPAYYYDPWFYPYPFYYWDPWWSYPYYYYYNQRYWNGPIYRRIPRPSQPPPSGAPSGQQRRGPRVERLPQPEGAPAERPPEHMPPGQQRR